MENHNQRQMGSEYCAKWILPHIQVSSTSNSTKEVIPFSSGATSARRYHPHAKTGCGKGPTCSHKNENLFPLLSNEEERTKE